VGAGDALSTSIGRGGSANRDCNAVEKWEGGEVGTDGAVATVLLAMPAVAGWVLVTCGTVWGDGDGMVRLRFPL